MTEPSAQDRELAASIALPAETGPRRTVIGSLSTMPAWLGGVVGVVVIVALWWLVSFVFFRVDQSIPYPNKVVVELVRDFGDGIFWSALWHTLWAAIQGYFWGNLIAFVLAALVLLVPLLDGLVTQFAVVCSCIPLTALGPILAIMSQPGSHFTAVVLGVVSVIFTSVVGAVLGLRAASSAQLDVVRAAGGSALTQLVKVRLIAALPAIMAALKIAAPAAFLGSVLGEYYLLGVDSGLGIQLLAAQSDNDSVRLWSLALVCGGVAGLAYFLIGLLGRLISPWSDGSR